LLSFNPGRRSRVDEDLLAFADGSGRRWQRVMIGATLFTITFVLDEAVADGKRLSVI
jgi:hypothetical protein